MALSNGAITLNNVTASPMALALFLRITAVVARVRSASVPASSTSNTTLWSGCSLQRRHHAQQSDGQCQSYYGAYLNNSTWHGCDQHQFQHLQRQHHWRWFGCLLQRRHHAQQGDGQCNAIVAPLLITAGHGCDQRQFQHLQLQHHWTRSSAHPNGAITLNKVTASTNFADGVKVESNNVAVSNSNISHNDAYGIYATLSGGTLTLNHVTLMGNTSGPCFVNGLGTVIPSSSCP